MSFSFCEMQVEKLHADLTHLWFLFSAAEGAGDAFGSTAGETAGVHNHQSSVRRRDVSGKTTN